MRGFIAVQVVRAGVGRWMDIHTAGVDGMGVLTYVVVSRILCFHVDGGGVLRGLCMQRVNGAG